MLKSTVKFFSEKPTLTTLTTLTSPVKMYVLMVRVVRVIVCLLPLFILWSGYYLLDGQGGGQGGETVKPSVITGVVRVVKVVRVGFSLKNIFLN